MSFENISGGGDTTGEDMIMEQWPGNASCQTRRCLFVMPTKQAIALGNLVIVWYLPFFTGFTLISRPGLSIPVILFLCTLTFARENIFL